MKRRTKNFVEDILIIIGVLFILYLIYFFVFSKDNDLSFETATKESKVEMETKDSKVFVSENGFLSQIYEDIKNKLFADNNDELLTIKKVEEENKEDNTKNIYLSQRAEILSKQEERVKEDLNTQQEQTTKNEENISTENRNIEALKQEEIKDKVVENKLATEQKNEEPVQQIKDNDHKDETILLEPKTTLETKTLEDVKTDENSEEAHHEVSNIDDFFDRFEKKVYSNIDRNLEKLIVHNFHLLK